MLIYLFSGKTYQLVCKPGWGDRHNDYCYKKFLKITTNWRDARNTCHSQGGFLVGIRDQQTQNHIQGTYKLIFLKKWPFCILNISNLNSHRRIYKFEVIIVLFALFSICDITIILQYKGFGWFLSMLLKEINW